MFSKKFTSKKVYYLFKSYLLIFNSSQGIIDASKLNTFSKLLYILQRLYTCNSNPFNITDNLVSECDKTKKNVCILFNTSYKLNKYFNIITKYDKNKIY